MIESIIRRYKRMRDMSSLSRIYHKNFALVGFGSHCVSNILPIIQYLQLPLKTICITSPNKAKLIADKYPNIKCTTSLDDILKDETIEAVFVVANPKAHYSISKKILSAGKALFVEKPACSTSEELNSLLSCSGEFPDKAFVVGLQRRFSPVTSILSKRLHKHSLQYYTYKYCVGAYPEGDSLLELFIHPIDLAVYLFGEAQIKFIRKVAKDNASYLVCLEHNNISGMLELSTAHTWHSANEEMKIVTKEGIFEMTDMNKLEYTSADSFMGIPLEKVLRSHHHKEVLYSTNQMIPIIANNQLVAQGFFDEIKIFADAVEKNSSTQQYLHNLNVTYRLIEEIRMFK